MKQFKGRVITPGEVTAEAVVTTQGFNTLASFQMALQFGDKEVKCGDQNNEELHGKPMIGKALCLPQTIGSTTGGLVLYCACAMHKNPACMLFANHIDSVRSWFAAASLAFAHDSVVKSFKIMFAHIFCRFLEFVGNDADFNASALQYFQSIYNAVVWTSHLAAVFGIVVLETSIAILENFFADIVR